MIKSKARLLIVAAALVGVGVVGTMSLLTDTAQTSIEVTSAQFGIEVNGSDTGTYTVVIDATNIKPGETRHGDITIENTSSIPAIVEYSANTLTGFTVALVDEASAPFTTQTLAVGESVELELQIGLPSGETVSPADQTLTVTFEAEQTQD